MGDRSGGADITPLDRFVLQVVGQDIGLEIATGSPPTVVGSARDVAKMLETSTLETIWSETRRYAPTWHGICEQELATRGIDVGA
jgi:hypothetical protein